MFKPELRDNARALLDLYRARGLKIVTAESCTGGLIAGLLTSVAGSSDVVDRGFVTYSNAAKTDMIGVPASAIERFGAVSFEVAQAMAEGALSRSDANVSIAVTGVAGPGGGSLAKPVGLVHIAVARKGEVTSHKELRLGNIGREAIRLETLREALRMAYVAGAGGAP